MTVLVIVLLLVCLGLPLFYAWHIWRLDEPSILGWLLVVADACTFVALTANGMFVGTLALRFWVQHVICSRKEHCENSMRRTTLSPAPASFQRAIGGDLFIYERPARIYLGLRGG